MLARAAPARGLQPQGPSGDRLLVPVMRAARVELNATTSSPVETVGIAEKIAGLPTRGKHNPYRRRSCK
jgi:hypothetical protein